MRTFPGRVKAEWGPFLLFQVLHWHKLLEDFIVALNIWLRIYESSRDPYFKTITFSPEAQTITALEFSVLQCKSFKWEKYFV